MAESLSDALVGGVAHLGADTVFGLPGGGPNLDVVGAAGRAGLRFVLTHGETAACVMAATYGLLRGRPALAIATRGPGVTSAANGVAQATLDRFPLLFVSDCVPVAEAGRVVHQRIDQTRLMGPITKWSGTLGTHRSRQVVEAALRLAMADPAGAVHLDFDPTDPGDAPAEVADPPPSGDQAMDQARRLASRASRPLVLAGAGCASAAAASMQSMLGHLDCPVLLTYQAAGLVDPDASNFGGLFTNGAVERPLLDGADLIVCVGLDPVEPIPADWPSTAPVISLHHTRIVDPYYPITVELTGPVDELLGRLHDCLGGTWPHDSGAKARRAGLEQLRSMSAVALGPVEVVDAVVGAAPPGTLATVDAGAHFLAVMPLWPARQPHSLLISNGLATMGFALPAAIGAALARPDGPIVCFVGDGGLGMTLAELETVARLGLPITVVVFNDALLSLIAVKQTTGHGGDGAVRYRSTDFAAVARASGLEAIAVDTAADLADAVASGWDAPRLIDVAVDPTPYAHLIRVTRG